ncbi:hypothetical protein BKG77_01630 [Mycobacteroides chelonae]|uniref:N-acyl-D-glucosamine 2-epimerase n=1 Tax=Mycobacteroides chelonae TaxID=1774 RepID=A0A1S1LZA2_MYCCH|nr:AGE family epimerase/isomerase [Mycobacteroides chelonae]OHU28268.1 hypothetical protein BKG77_01630 [Mycobacteroides chelonae]OHU63685.1 hypothetical protein BKG85_09285 [Mycobacteroides chelonae]OHU76426.1 hypothetical protein BKG84_24320 [Mycobacteroides chelonae]QQG88317.1 N-acyl-D-glucosamine 2-epimerase [Mycobacteroides chelonae]QQG93134.1 N-acyl-D-glucosamine 2-epimerase [Mycobacteroides chelonae]
MVETYSDSVMGYLDELHEDHLTLRGIDGELLRLEMNTRTSVQRLRNLGEEYVDGTADLFAGRVPQNALIIAYGPIVPYESGTRRYASTITIVGALDGNPIMEPTWWITQITQIANFYRNAQFGDGPIDFQQYRTNLDRSGRKHGDIQETAVLSRLIYGMASSFLLTGNDDHLTVATAGCAYMLENMRMSELAGERDPFGKETLWYHRLEVTPGQTNKILASQFPDDRGSIPAYEQIYALAGLTQTYRATGDPALLEAIQQTVRLFDIYFKDPLLEGYYSHIDPETWGSQSSRLGQNKAKKNWNSNGDHAPAYLFNLYLSTGDPQYLEMLTYTFGIIATHFPQSGLRTRVEETPFVRERFNADWTVDENWGWQQDRAVVGHNLKIAWNFIRMSVLSEDPRLLGYATRIAHTMPNYGLDVRRGGWYDVLERALFATDRFTWHDRKAWWQQEQAILAYLILAARVDPLYENEAFEAAAFYNANFLDHDFGGVFPTVLASGMPYGVGEEGGKGSHSMGMYHSAELCYLSAVYTALMLRKEPLYLWFKPAPDQNFPGNILRVAPDTLTQGSVFIASVLVNGELYDKYDSANLTVTLPESTTGLTIRVRLDNDPRHSPSLTLGMHV